MQNFSYKEQKNVLFVLPFWRRGGAEKQFRFIVEGFAEEGFNIDLVFLNDDQSLKDEVPVRKAFTWNVPIWNGVESRFFRNLLRLFGYLGFVINFLIFHTKNYDAIITHHKLLIPLIPVLNLKTSKMIFSLREANSVYTRHLYKHLLSLADLITCNSQQTYKMLNETFESVELINNGISVDPDGLPADLSTSVKQIGVVTNLTPRKNVEVVIESLQFLPDEVSLGIAGKIGDQGYLEELKSLVDSLGLESQIAFRGYIDDIQKFYGSCDVIVLPSLSEGTSNVVLETIRAGKPIICSDIPENRSVLLESYGDELLFNPEDPKDLANKINFLARQFKNEPEWAQSCIQDHYQLLKEKYSVKRMQENYIRLLDPTFMVDKPYHE